jgi:hypothetical protein
MNHGVILDELIPEDLIFGANDRVKHNINIEDRNWIPYFSKGEVQFATYYDTMGCVSFSGLNTTESVGNYHVRNKLFSADNVAWLEANGYFNADGDLDFSDRFTVAMSGTTEDGNTGRRVWTSIRHDGVVPESKWPWNKGRDVPQKERYGDWYRDKANVPQELIDLGKEFVKRFDVIYEVVKTEEGKLKTALTKSPVAVYIATNCPLNNGIHEPCGNTVNHAVTLCDDADPRGYYPLFDHYIKQPNAVGQEQFIRKVSKDFSFYSTAYVCTITEKQVEQPVEDMDNNFVRIVKDANSSAVGFWLPAISPATIENMCKIYGKEVPKKADGSIDWDNFIEGSLTLKP